MIYVLLSALLFGLVHPGSKLILSSGMPLILFCLLYVGIRLVTQLPFVLIKGSYRITGEKNYILVLGLGFVGALLQVSEFAGISDGVNVSVVTFLVYSHPVWSMLISKFFSSDKWDKIDYIKLGLAVLGILFVLGPEKLFYFDIKLYWAPLCAGFLIACWVKVSNVATRKGLSTMTLNFYYDLMSFICLVVIFLIFRKQESFDLSEYLKSPINFWGIVIYSIFVGLLPNLLFYKGSSKVGALAAGYILLLEPIISSVIAFFIWRDAISGLFLIGAGMIIFVNAPRDFFCKVFPYRLITIAISGIILISTTSNTNASSEKMIHLLEVSPTEGGGYTVQSERRQIEAAAEMAYLDYLAISKCNLKIKKDFNTGSEELLVEKIDNIKKTSSGNSILVGISRTNFARVAAQITKSDIHFKGISIGAATANLFSINKNFISVVNPWQEQMKLVLDTLKKNYCNQKNTISIFNEKDFYSKKFMDEFRKNKKWNIVTKKDVNYFMPEYKCVFMGLSYADSLSFLKYIQNTQNKWSGLIVGVGDWSIYNDEIEKHLSSISKNIMILVPVGWMSEINSNSKLFAQRFEKETKVSPSPIAAYTYDGVIIASQYLCKNKEVLMLKDVQGLGLLRKYSKVSESGNLVSPMYIKVIKGQRND